MNKTNGMVIPVCAGRMGNFLFHAASAMSYAWDHGMEFTLPNRTNSVIHNPIYLQHLVNPKFNPMLPRVTVQEKTFCWHEREFQESWRGCNIFLEGWWQTEKYFKKYREQILKAFNYPYHLIAGVSVHVRRGDYLRLRQKHPYVGPEWINRAMTLFPRARFHFFSDDINWCKAAFGHRSDCSFSGSPSPELDLIEMACYEHQICSASTFSWWGAWLNRNPVKRVILPRLWYVPGHGGLDTKDIVPEEWERL